MASKDTHMTAAMSEEVAVNQGRGRAQGGGGAALGAAGCTWTTPARHPAPAAGRGSGGQHGARGAMQCREPSGAQGCRLWGLRDFPGGLVVRTLCRCRSHRPSLSWRETCEVPGLSLSPVGPGAWYSICRAHTRLSTVFAE